MGCACRHNMTINVSSRVVDGHHTSPTTQCIHCAQKHFDEAWIVFWEHGYQRENLRFLRGSLRAIVLHTTQAYADIADLSRRCAIAVQGSSPEAETLMRQLGDMIDDAVDADGNK